jgi:hypothetical protein
MSQIARLNVLETKLTLRLHLRYGGFYVSNCKTQWVRNNVDEFHPHETYLIL